ncbi:MAG: DUF4249 domain-containing protein [Bacteroidetes bacterium]|nr:DUF4249 domain-containing protein [Bacteroidota bacterium]
MKYMYQLLICFLIALIAVLAHSCRKAYDPPVISAPNSYLVIEGNISSGSDSTFIRLSRTVRLSSKKTPAPETNAMVTVEGDQNTSYPLTEIKPGTYATAGLNLDPSHKYRLNVKTSTGKQYVSDYVPVLDAPPIDSVNYDANGNLGQAGMNIYVTTHDPANKVQYFRWDYTETWEFQSAFESVYYSNGDTVLPRNLNTDNIYQCWRSDSSNTVLLGNTARLTKSVIAGKPIAFINSSSEKVTVEYSILVREYALTSDAYNFYSELQKNTEQLGSIFDAQPSEVRGNIHCVGDPQEPVIGYVSAGAVSSKRIFVMASHLPVWNAVTFYTLDGCRLAGDPGDPTESCCLYRFTDKLGRLQNQVNDYINYNISHTIDPLTPVNSIGFPGQPPLGYTAAQPECVDCTLRGTNVKPAFWQ